MFTSSNCDNQLVFPAARSFSKHLKTHHATPVRPSRVKRLPALIKCPGLGTSSTLLEQPSSTNALARFPLFLVVVPANPFIGLS
ncbi:unnamed protein product [Protopolystoma xenopodis]|uniref:Uncharacterized protein n=1 Tax=Protopolystoma xenopodis TaxID=117903 RepID=A0A3S5AKT1_9PLAT|nr:unnamed protein product [Protopolystoma xenopodis]